MILFKQLPSQQALPKPTLVAQLTLFLTVSLLHSSLVVMFVLLVLVHFLLRNALQQLVATQELVKQSRSRRQSNQSLRLVRH